MRVGVVVWVIHYFLSLNFEVSYIANLDRKSYLKGKRLNII